MQLQQQSAPRNAPSVVFDSSMEDSIDQALALSLLLGFEAKRQVRVASVSLSRNNLKIAAFIDLMCRFQRGDQGGDFFGSRGALAVGMFTGGAPKAVVPPMLKAALDKPAYKREVADLNDTADPVALIRNALTAQTDGSAVVVLAGPPGNLVNLLALEDGKRWVGKKARLLVVAGGRFDSAVPDTVIKEDPAGFRTLLAGWPGPVVFAGAEVGEVLFPGSSLESAFAWAPQHPVVDVYRAARPMPYDAQTRAMAAVLYLTEPDQGYFRLSEPGTVTMLDDGRTQFQPSAGGKHRYLVLDPGQKQRIAEVYVKMTSAPPPPPPQRRGPPPAAAAKPVANLLALGALLGLAAAWPAQVAAQQTTFDQAVVPLLNETCSQCHNAQLASGGLDVTSMASVNSLKASRPVWDRIVRRLRAGEMPPPGFPKPPEGQIPAALKFLETNFEKLDAAAPADPGRVTAHRLNRNEYSNTVRDLLGVNFRAEKYFPTDDSGDGFDNIGDVLTVSPVLMERYLSAAERIAGWAISTEIPAKPVEHLYHFREATVRRVDRSTIETEHRVDFAGEYVVRIGLPGERAKDAAPATLGIWMDGKLLQSKPVETKPSGLVYFDPYSEEEMRIHLPEGDHVFRAGFIGDEFAKTLTEKDAYNRRVNKYLDSILFIGPYASKTEKESRKKILVCAPSAGRPCVDRILSNLARRAYRRPVTRAEVNGLLGFYDRAVRDGQSVEQGLQLAVQAMLVSPHFLFHLERETGRGTRPLSGYELASRLSYFLWSSMPDEELFDLARTGKLRANLKPQVDRMLADSRAAAFAENFAGQWLETRNVDFVKPDPDKFPEWDAELREAMKKETSLFFEYILRENRPASEFINAPYTFLNERLAKHYGIPGVAGGEFRRVDLTPGSPRGGVLGQAAVLTVSSYPTRTSPVIRGKYVLQNILGTPPPPPPPDVPLLDESTIGATMSLRKQMEKHRANPTCASCHSKMDPLGFGLENFNAIGKWREKDGSFAVDATGTLPNGLSFSTPAEMRSTLTSQLPQFSRTLTEKLMTYALGRGIKPEDGRTVDTLNRAWAQDGYRFQSIIHQIVNSLPFQSKRGEQP